jgi:hypothetical protein
MQLQKVVPGIDGCLMEFKKGFLSLNAANVLKILTGLGSSYLVYRALRIYWQMRRYNHIPGPPFEG